MAACTSVAASVILLLRTNCKVNCVLLCVLLLVMISSPGICKNCFSSGVAMLLFAVVLLCILHITLRFLKRKTAQDCWRLEQRMVAARFLLPAKARAGR